MADVWIVTYGDYSAYRIVGAFSAAEAAHETARRLSCGEEEPREENHVTIYGPHDDGYKVERYELDEVAWEARYKAHANVEKGKPKGEVSVSALSARDGDDVSRRGVHLLWWLAYDHGGSESLDQYGNPRTPSVQIDAFEDDPERAWKAAAERAYRVAAEWDIHVEAARSRGELA